MEALRRSAGLIAAVLVAASGGVLTFGAPVLGLPLLVVGAVAAVWQARQQIASRQDPYDLSRLWEREQEPPGEAEPEEDVEDDGTVYCHACGHAVPEPFAMWPECGRTLR